MKRKITALFLVLSLMLSLSVPALAAGTSFVDVTKDNAYYKAVKWAKTEKVTAGVDATHFAPGGKATRAQAVTFLWNMAGRVDPVRTGTFSDVPQGSYYELPVIWALLNSVATSANTPADGLFHSNDACTRGEMISFIYQFHLLEDAQQGIWPSEKIEETVLLDTDEFSATAHGMIRESGVTPLLDVAPINKTSKEVVFTPEVAVNGKVIESCDFITIEKDEESGITFYPVIDSVDHGQAMDCYLRINGSMLEEAGITNIGEIKVKLTVTDFDPAEPLAESKKVIIKTDLYDEVMK